MKPIVGDIVFLFEVGASKGAAPGHVLPDSPLVMTGLYDRLARRYPTDTSDRASHFADVAPFIAVMRGSCFSNRL